MDITGLTIKKTHEGLRQKEFSARELAEAFLKEIESRDTDTGAYLSVDSEGALADAKQVDEIIAGGGETSPLAGVPVALKDVLLQEGRPATAGSKILKDYISAYDATAVEKLKDEHAVFLGKTNMDEFAMGSSTENSGYHVTKNPHDLARVPGGSSGGSAAAVAADLAVAALGTDTGGSIRQPAAFSGVVGLKPTYGAVSRYGTIAMASSLDQIGPLAKTVEDAATLFYAIAGHDPKDATSSPDATYTTGDSDLKPDAAKKLVVGIPDEYFVEGMDDAVARTMEGIIDSFEKLGLKTKKISLPHTKYALSVYYLVMPAEASTNLARFDGIRYGTRGNEQNLLETYFTNRGEGFGPEVKRRIILGTFALSAGYYDQYYDKAQRVRTLILRDFEEAFKEVDVILTPTTPTPAFKIGEKTDDPLQMYLSDVFTIPTSLAGLPGISIPARENTGKLPVGFQLIGRHFREADILGIGRMYEQSVD